jgi:isopropylmalate/homocitrate/citramalate synthase
MNKDNYLHLKILDSTLREGAASLQGEHCFNDQAWVEIAHEITRLGVDTIEIGSPYGSNNVSSVQKEVAQTIGNSCLTRNSYQIHPDRSITVESDETYTPQISALSTINQEQIDKTWDALEVAFLPIIHIVVPSADNLQKLQYPDNNRFSIAKMTALALDYAKDISSSNTNSQVALSFEGASKTNYYHLDYLIHNALDHGVDIINLPDSEGVRDPWSMEKLYEYIFKIITAENSEVTISAHNHNDLGLAAINSLTLIKTASQYKKDHELERGFKLQVEASVGGLGKRAGICDIFTLMAGIEQFSPILGPLKYGFNPIYSVEVANVVFAYANMMVDPKSPIVGRDVADNSFNLF